MAQSNLYEISVSNEQELIWYIVEVKHGCNTYCFEINKTDDYLVVYFIDQWQRRLIITSVEGTLDMIVDEVDKQRYLSAIRAETDADWLLLDGIHSDRGMTEEEQAAFLHLKETVLDKEIKNLDGYKYQ